MTNDRHARHRRRPADPGRRPSDGWRAPSSRAFDRLVEDALGTLPPQLADLMDNVAIVVEDVPPADVVDGEDGVLLGLYEGVPQTERGDGWFLPDRVTIFRRPLEMRSRSKAELAAAVRVTVVHEVAHHFGIDDDRLDDLGWG